jgi:hypothetical protein
MRGLTDGGRPDASDLTRTLKTLKKENSQL